MPALPISKKQLHKLGERLRDHVVPDPADRVLLEEVLSAYGAALQGVTTDLRALGFDPASRLKATGTIIEKLRRGPGSSLKTIHDLAGARVVLPGDLGGQDDAVDHFCAGRDPVPTRIDRRADPRSGYRAVHVVVRVDGIPVEVQFRTQLQDLWAEVFERLGDALGRQIRYGGTPTPDPDRPDVTAERSELVQLMLNLSITVAGYEELCSAVPIKEAEAEVAQMAPHHDWVRSNYLAFQAARADTDGRLRRRLTELARRIEMVVEQR